ncbi:MAG: cell division protein FtsA [Chloroflexi bacterium]|nr:cell division protein FtsA [Chloroflexota bacterium]
MGKNLFAALDVGTTKTCAILANAGDGGAFRVLGVGLAPSRGLRKGVVINLHEAKETIQGAVKKAEHASGIRMESAYVGVTGRHVTSMNTWSAVAISRGDRRVRDGDLKRVMESARSIEVPSDRKLLHVITRQYVLDGHEGIKDPRHMHGFRLDANAHVVTASTAAVQNLVKAVRAVGLEVEDLVLMPLASGEAVLRRDEKEAGVIMADIGGGTCDVAMWKDGSVTFTSVLPVGGYQVTRDIAVGLGIPFELAEQIKIKYGSLIPSADKKAKLDASRVGLDNGQEILLQDLNNIIRARVDELLRMVLMELPRSEHAALAPAGLVLTGGTSNLPGIEALAQDIFRLPVRAGVPKDVYGLADILYDPAYATTVGLLMWGAKKSAREELPRRRRERVGKVFRRFFFRARRAMKR